MSVARARATRAVPTAPKPASRTTARARAQGGADELVDGLGKLAISAPESRATKTKPAPPAPKASSSRAAPVAVPSRRAAPASVAAGKGKEKAACSLEGSLPWACSTASTTLKPGERATQAMQAINASIKSLSQAEQSGYRFSAAAGAAGAAKAGASSTSAGTGTDASEPQWIDDKVVTVVDTCQIAFRVLRELDEAGHLGSKGVEVEKACQGAVSKCLQIGMTRKAMELIVEARAALLRLYKPRHITPEPSAQLAPARISAPSRTATSAASRSTARTAPAARSRAAAPAPKAVADTKAKPTLPKSWLDAAWMPAPDEGTVIADGVKSLLFSSMMSAWVALVAMTKGGDEILPALTFPASQPTGKLHPLTLALTLPRHGVTPLLYNLYRSISTLTLPPTSPSFLHLRQTALLALALTISSSPESKNTPNQLWETAHRVIATAVNADTANDRLREAANVVGGLVDWVEGMTAARGETGWFAGKGWSGLVDMWIAMARRLGASDIIDKALSLMTASTSIASPSPCIPASIASTAAFKGDPQAEITRIRGDLAKASVVFDKLLSSQPAPGQSSIDGLSVFDLQALAHVINALPTDKETGLTVDRAVRAWERVRRGCVKVLDKHGAGGEWKGVVEVVGEWSKAAIVFAEAVAGRVETDPTLASYLVSGTVDTIIVLSQRSLPSSLSLLTRGHALHTRTSQWTAKADQSGWLRCLSTTAYNAGGKLYTQGKPGEALPLVKGSCEWGVEALGLVDGEVEGAEEYAAMGQLRESLAKRWEFLAGCYQKTGSKQGIFTAYTQCFASQPPSTLAKLTAASSSQPISQIFASLPDLTASIARVASFVFYEPSLAKLFGKDVVRLMQERGEKAETTGALGEGLMGKLEEGVWAGEVATLVLDLGEAVLELYGEEFPVRRMRVIAKMMGVIATSGQQRERFPALVEEVEALSARTDSANDKALAPFKKEYEAYALILRALQAYHDEADPSLAVSQGAQRALVALRGIVLPPTPAAASTPALGSEQAVSGTRRKQPLGRATTTKAVPARPVRGAGRAVSEPAKKVAAGKAGAKATAVTKGRASVAPTPMVFDDLRRLTRLLGSLSSLLGLLGHALAKVEVLKLLRAFERNQDDLLDDYVQRSAQLATEYFKLGKLSRAGFVFTQALKSVADSKVLVNPGVQVELLLRWSCYLAGTGNVSKAREAYSEAEMLNDDYEADKAKSPLVIVQVMNRCDTLERAAWARSSVAAISAAQDDASTAIIQLSAAFRLWTRASDTVCRIAETIPTASPSPAPVPDDDPFSAPSAPTRAVGADEPSKDDSAPIPAQAAHFTKKHLDNLQWHVACGLLDVTLNLAQAFAARGSVRDCEYFLKVAGQVSEAVKSGGMSARVGARQADVLFRLRKYEEVEGKLESAAQLLSVEEGPDVIELMKVQGDLYSRQELVEEAHQIFTATSKEIAGLDQAFVAAEALLPTPKKAVLAASNASAKSLPTPRKSVAGKEPLLPVALAHVLRQHAWLLREAGSKEECEQLLVQMRGLPSSTETKAEELLLQGRIALHEAFNQFKTDLFMSSLTESAVAMPMGNPEKRVNDRQSTRLSIKSVLARAEDAFLSALDLVAGSGRIEGIRQACLALGLLRAFQTSLGQGSAAITASAAEVLASSSSITLQRELLQAIECKFVDIGIDDPKWTSLEPPEPKAQSDRSFGEDLDDLDGKLRSYWKMVKTKYTNNPLLGAESSSLDILPPDWAVVSINISEDRNTMFISRHQRDHEPIVFCLPLDRQGRREGDDDIWTFDTAVGELEDIIKLSNEGARRAKGITSTEGKAEWWAERRALDKRMEELCVNIEFVWLGAFKTILSSRSQINAADLSDFRDRLGKIFHAALSGGRNAKGKKSSPKLHLDDALLECFATLSSKCKEEEVEDLVYFILDIYQFHGVPVALSELDIDQIAVDVKGALEKLEARQKKSILASQEEHIFLALDKNVQSFPWESIPILRGRPVSRIPSLSFLLDQVAMGNHLRPSLTQSVINLDDEVDMKRTVNSRRTFYILNPSGDLERTQAHFKPWIDEMVQKAGWKGIVGRPPTEMEMKAALRDHDLVLYFGHGGAEQYISSHKIRCLPQCATTMLWGCSSGHLRDQGDFDRTGTAWHYMVAGCPSLVGNLWDVTDRDIDRLSEHVLKQGLHLDSAHQPHSKSRSNTMLPLSELSTVQAVNRARNECKLKYLNGAAPVVYGLPVYLH
ncbi:hypothetical protein IAT38_000341 [Cryptococcus sp. DSM 104549]